MSSATPTASLSRCIKNILSNLPNHYTTEIADRLLVNGVSEFLEVNPGIDLDLPRPLRAHASFPHETLLEFALKGGFLGFTKLLLENGARTNFDNVGLNTEGQGLYLSGKEFFVQRIDLPSIFTVLRTYKAEKHEQNEGLINLLLQHNADINQKIVCLVPSSPSGLTKEILAKNLTPLDYAVMTGNSRLVEFLCEKGATINSDCHAVLIKDGVKLYEYSDVNTLALAELFPGIDQAALQILTHQTEIDTQNDVTEVMQHLELNIVDTEDAYDMTGRAEELLE